MCFAWSPVRLMKHKINVKCRSRGTQKRVVHPFLASISMTSLVIKWKTKYLELQLDSKIGKLSIPHIMELPLLCPCVLTYTHAQTSGN